VAYHPIIMMNMDELLSIFQLAGKLHIYISNNLRNLVFPFYMEWSNILKYRALINLLMKLLTHARIMAIVIV